MNTDKPVLLFYDGHERRAEPAWAPRLMAETRRHARYIRNRVLNRQMRSGYYTWLFMLREALEDAGHLVEINNFEAARRWPDHPIGLVGYPTIMDKVADLPNPRLIGPGFFRLPFEDRAFFEDSRNKLFLCTCQWFSDVLASRCEERLRPWFGGFNVQRFEDVAGADKQYDVLIYDKIYFERDMLYAKTIKRFTEDLERRGLTYTIIRYGDYSYDDYLKKLKASRSMAFFAHSETQGMAYQECLAMNVPIFAWDEGHWMDPFAQEISNEPIPCTSVPYFDDRCGLRFQAENMLEIWAAFWERKDAFEPRAFIADTMTFERSSAAYMAAYGEISPVRAA